MGPPRIVHTDKGRNESDLSKEACRAFGIKKTRTTPYHPEGDGLVERGNRTILQILRSLADKDSQWDQLLPAAVLAYNTFQHATTGFTPYELMFGRQPLLVDGPFHVLEQQGYDPPSYHDQLLARMQRTCHSARSHIQKAAERQRGAYDAHNTAKPVYQAGDSVWLYRRNCAKLKPRWEGDWLISRNIGPVTLEIQDRNGHRKIVHANDLRKVEQSEDTGERPQIRHPAETNSMVSLEDPSPSTAHNARCNIEGRPTRRHNPPQWFSDYVPFAARGRAQDREGRV
ncbi:hypothetical protein M514_11406 [Trichuris suis]|uniref:Integrase catalytic domain-containing protein n=1 Tax=Trichuris suis TaxID=68888 RepID=A0A085MUE6_9BILA|nr:hypothetical protein M514_11406 [Trichuris suis]